MMGRRTSAAGPVLALLVLLGAPARAAHAPPDMPASFGGSAGAASTIRLAQAGPQPQPASQPTNRNPQPAPPAPAQQSAQPQTSAPADEPIGNVVKLQGTASVTRNKNSIALKLKDDIYKNDVLQTGPASALGVTFNDSTTFNLTANARVAVDNYVYEDNGKSNAALFDIGKGTVAFVAASVAKTGDMKITTPSSSLGIRGTSGLVEVPEGGAPNNIKLYPDPDGRVGRIDVNGRDGVRLGQLTQGASGFAVRPGTGGARSAAVSLQISPQQVARDQGIVRQVHTAQTAGRQIVQQQRALRQTNPQRPTPATPGQRQNAPGQRPNAPGQPEPGQQRPGQQGQTTPRPGQPASAARPGQTAPGGQTNPNPAPGQTQPAQQPGAQQPATQQPGARRQPGLQQPGLQQPGLRNRPAVQRRPPGGARPRGQKERR